MHNNPMAKKKGALCDNPVEYVHSSAKFYITGEQSLYPVNFIEMEDITFSGSDQQAR